MNLKIIHTNDLHSHFDNFARVVTVIKEHQDENTVTLDGGDFADFKSIELQGTRGLAAVELLEYVGYDALTIGNNEMFNGVDTLQLMATESKLPFLSNNLYKKDRSNLNGVVSSTILEKNGLHLLITGSSPDLDGFNDGLGIYVTSFKEELQNVLKANQGNYDICILLSHIGTEADAQLAQEVEGLDIIISAHDHQLYTEAKLINGVIMNSAGNYGEHVGIMEVEVTDNQVTLIDSKTIATKDSPSDEGILSILKVNKAKAEENLSQPLYALQESLWHDVIEENPITNLIADGLKDMLDCELGIMNSGIVNAGAFSFISKKKLIEICPSPLNPTSFEIQGKYIRQALEASLDSQTCLADGRGPGFRGKYVGRLHVSGATIQHDGKHITEVLVGDEPLDDEKWYKVASSDYLQRGSGYPTLANNRNEKYLAEEIKDVIRIYGAKEEYVQCSFKKRWVLNRNE
ncbi:bifunctional metallophosphatase/5'-nucleotidase [Salirhabdus sp. Marseille-P4669]|uniref:bifunctional metallophosphatase/5'-nucleotidase n=1 Tax=Salirhabdus sp. Marseille-P4669 TaxID=2042310 RepID=UPI000C7CD1D6|nr:5'-nucleotidase C-terminal domain-containing protein [Salirhabdus sp. Marseille-P4669]